MGNSERGWLSGKDGFGVKFNRRGTKSYLNMTPMAKQRE